MKLIRCDSSFAEPIRAIFNDAILNSTALYDYRPRTPEMMRAWFEQKQRGDYPVIGAVSEDGELMGFGSYGPFRVPRAYKYCVEHSIYVAARFRRQGLGKKLLQEVISSARIQDYHVLVGVIDSANTVSIKLHEQFGFEHAGTIRHAGYKFGRWLDVMFYQLVLDTPTQPVDG